MTHQEIFNKVARHLLTQNKKSVLFSGGSCAYRGKDGLKCAIGCLISDDDYCFAMEGNSVTTLSYDFPGLGLREITEQSNLLLSFQNIHDNFPPNEWWKRLLTLATFYNLSAEVLQEFVNKENT